MRTVNLNQNKEKKILLKGCEIFHSHVHTVETIVHVDAKLIGLERKQKERKEKGEERESRLEERHSINDCRCERSVYNMAQSVGKLSGNFKKKKK